MNAAAVEQMIQQALATQESRFQQTIASLQDQLTVATTAASARTTRRPRLPDPDRFDGTFDMWETWYPEIQAKLDLDGDALGGTERAKFWYVYGRLEKKPKSLVSPQLAAAERDHDLYAPKPLFDQLLRLCNNPNARREAESKLLSLRQFSDQTFNAFLGVFERLLYRSGANTWPDEAKIAVLRKALVDKLRKRLDAKEVQDNLPTAYTDYVAVVQTLESGQDYLGQKDKKLWVPKADAGNGGEPMQIGAMSRLIGSTEYSDDDSEVD